jgi:hypothetical protein
MERLRDLLANDDAGTAAGGSRLKIREAKHNSGVRSATVVAM